MRYITLATDYDGTIATHGRVPKSVVDALKNLQASGRKLILATGRELADLVHIFPEHEIFDLIVAENGGTIYNPKTKKERLLCEPPTQKLVDALRSRGVSPMSVGRTIIATWEPHDTAVLETIRELGLEMPITFNKGAVMVLPPGINKGTGVRAAIAELGISAHNLVGVGDAENDHAFLSICEFSVAVQNALKSLQERADMVTEKDHGAGVEDLIEKLIENDLKEYSPKRHFFSLGKNEDGSRTAVDSYGTGILICGISGGGKSKTTLGVLENLSQSGQQFCLIDPEGDYQSFDNAVVLGEDQRPPTIEESLQLLASPKRSAIINLLGLPLEDRPKFFTKLLPRLNELRTTYGRPHWIVVDEAHHLFPSEWKKFSDLAPQNLRSILMITVHPERIAPESLASIDVLIAVGDDIEGTVLSFAKQAHLDKPTLPRVNSLVKGKGLVWFARSDDPPQIVSLERAEMDKVRHRRKYAEGELPEKDSFYFRGPNGKLNLRVQNLTLFNQIGEGVDDQTWTHHLRNHDYSRWFRDVIKDDKLSEEAQMIESHKSITPKESRALIRSAIESRYTLPS